MFAVHEGLSQAEIFSYTNYTLESDCKMVIDQLLTQSESLNSLGHIHRQIISLVDRQSVVLFFTRLDGNILTHLLTAKVISTYPTNI